MTLVTVHGIKSLSREALNRLVTERLTTVSEDEALAILGHQHCDAPICQAIAQSQRLTAFYSIRLRLVEHRSTPQAHAVKLVHYLHWPDMVRLSVDVRVAPPVRRALETQ